MNDFLEPCIRLAEQAGDAIMAIYQQDDIGAEQKSDHTPVTKADLASNDVLMAGLKAIAPDIPIMSEETPIPALADRKDWHRYWLLDPMDGTGEFILESGDFAVNIALVENNRPVLGVIHWPAKQVTYFASYQNGAFKRENGQDQQISVATPDNLTLAVSRRQKIEKELADLGAQIIAVSPDSPEKLAESKITSPNYQLLSDDSLLLAQKLGLAFYLDDKTAKIYRNKLGVNFVSLEGEVKVALPVPAVFVIDTNGLVNFQYANPNYKVRLTEDLLLAAVKSVNEQ